MKTRSLLRPRIAAVLALVERSRRGEVEAVHDFRVAARSLRAGLRTMSRRPDGSSVRDARRSLQAAIRGLADPRDRDVGRALLSRKLQAMPADAPTRRRLISLIESDRRLALAHANAAWPRRLDARLLSLLSADEPALRTMMRRTAAEAYRQRGEAIAMVRALGRRYDPTRLHDLRRTVRRVRYALEALSEVDFAAAPRATRLKPLQSALGDIQDRAVLASWLSARAGRFQRVDRGLASILRALAREARADSRRAHARFLALRPEALLARLELHRQADFEGAGPSSRAPSPRPRIRRAAQAAP